MILETFHLFQKTNSFDRGKSDHNHKTGLQQRFLQNVARNHTLSEQLLTQS